MSDDITKTDDTPAPPADTTIDPFTFKAADLPALVTAASERVLALAGRTTPEEIRTHIGALVIDARSQATIAGVLCAPEEALKTFEETKRREFDAEAQADAHAVIEQVDWTFRALEAHEAAAKVLAVPKAQTPEHKSLDRLVALQEATEARVRFAGRPLQELVDAYLATDDQAAPHFVRMLEDEAARGFPSLPVRREAADLPARAELTKAIAARQAARVPPAIGEARAALKATWTSVTQAKIALIAQGRAQLARPRASAGAGPTRVE